MDPPDGQTEGYGSSSYGLVSPYEMRREHRGGNLAKRTVFALLASVAAIVAVWQISSGSPVAPSSLPDFGSDDPSLFGMGYSDNDILSTMAMDETLTYHGARASTKASAAGQAKFQQMGLTSPTWFMRIIRNNGAAMSTAKTIQLNERANSTGKTIVRPAPATMLQNKKNLKPTKAEVPPGLKPVMDDTACTEYLCSLDPPITDNGASLKKFGGANPTQAPDEDVANCLSEINREKSKSYSDWIFGSAPSEEVRVSWINDQACQYALQRKSSPEEKAQIEAQSSAAAAASSDDAASKAAKTAAREKMMNALGPDAVAKDLEKIHQAEDPNKSPFVPAPLGSADCKDLHELPGVAFLSSGWDPEVHAPCSFDDCRTRRIVKFTYLKGCRTVITPGGTFKIPDQITVLNKYETTASTVVSQNQEEKDEKLAVHANMAYNAFSGAARGGYALKEENEMHVADRKIDVKLYTMYVDNDNQPATPTATPTTVTTSTSTVTATATTSTNITAKSPPVVPIRNSGLEAEFVFDASQLPVRFGLDAHSFLRFLRKWGRYVPRKASFGGTVVITMKFNSVAGVKNINAGVEAAFDGISGSFGAGMKFDKDDTSLAAHSEIFLEANGGDPQIAAVISDFSPQTHSTASFRGDLQAWLKTVPMYPRLVERIPQLVLVTEMLPTRSTKLQEGKTDLEDLLEWKMRRRALEQAIEVMSTTVEAMHASSQQCSKDYEFKDFNRLIPNECLSFGVHAPGGFGVSFAEEPMRNEASLRLQIGVFETGLFTWDTKATPPEWVKIWSSDSIKATARGTAALMGKYWMCVQENQTTSTFLFGKNDDLVLKQKIVMPKGLGEVFDPRYFAFSCDGDEGYFSNIEVDPINVYEAYLEVEAKGVAAVGEVSGKLCSIPQCSATTEGKDAFSANTASTCRCTDCEKGYILVKGDGINVYDSCVKSAWKIETTQYIGDSLSSDVVWGSRMDYLGCYKDTPRHRATTPGNQKMNGGLSELFKRCSMVAHNEKRGGFCMENANECWYVHPGQWSPDEFALQAQTEGPADCEGSGKPAGVHNQWVMQCYKVQEQNVAYYMPGLCFGGNGGEAKCLDLKTLIPAVGPLGFYLAWKVSGKYAFEQDIAYYKWCMEVDEQGKLWVNGVKKLDVTTYVEGEQCTSVLTGAKIGDVTDILVEGMNIQGPFRQVVWIKDCKDKGCTIPTDLDKETGLTGFQDGGSGPK